MAKRDEKAGEAASAPEQVEAPAVEAPAVETAEAADTAALQQQLAEAEAKAAEHWDQLLRAKAELDNIRRRAERDLENAHKYALDRFTQELLPVVDSMEMGIKAAESAQAEVSQLREGAELTLKMLLGVLERFGIKAVDPQGHPFNPELHQAMTMQQTADAAPNTVVAVYQKGYQLNDRLVRPAMVVVAAPPPDAAQKIDEHA